MKKAVVFLIFSVLLVGFMAFVLADGQGQGQGNAVGRGNDNQSEGDISNSRGGQAESCVEKDSSCCIGNSCKKTSKYCGENLTNFEGCDEKCKPVLSCKVRKENIIFVPYQKKNESECLEGCKCVGAVMSCETETGKVMSIEAGRSGNIITITVNKTYANTSLELEQEKEQNRTRLKARLSNGEKREVKIMPDIASEKAREKLGELNFTVQLKEKEKGDKTELIYELQAERHMRVFALFRAKAKVKAEIDAETGEVIITKKPWWAFLAREE